MTEISTRRFSFLFFIYSFVMICDVNAASVFYETQSRQAGFAVDEIEKALLKSEPGFKRFNIPEALNIRDDIKIILTSLTDTEMVDRMMEAGASKPGELMHEGYCIRKTENDSGITLWVIGGDESGTLYGGLEVAELIKIGGIDSVKDSECNPYMSMRGVKFNIPLDVRTPSYTDVCDAAQKNIIEMWNYDFWTEYIDELVRDRYNFISFWNLHPFPSLVRVPEYPDIALDDVKRSTVKWKENYDLEATGFDDPEILNHVETIKKISIDEKMEFWRKVMRYAKERNIDIYFVTWNIFTYGTDGKYGITDDIANEITLDYFRKSVEQMFLTYPDLAGIGLTTGENMRNASFDQKEDWAFNTYGLGLMDASIKQPERRFTLIHRQHMAGAKDILNKFASVTDRENINFLFSFKYAKAHVFSSTTQTFHHEFVKDIGDMKTLWTLRNDDIYHFRWGAPDFIRDFIKQIPHQVTMGFYYGSDQYVWGREFLSKYPESPRQLEISKHWYHWMLWGRLGFDPDLGDDRFVGMIQDRFPEVSGKEIFEAWQAASMTYPLTTGFHWGALDFQWYIEACKSRPGPAETETGFHDVNRFITLKPHPGSGNLSIPDYVRGYVTKDMPNKITPVEVSQKLTANADKALAIVSNLDSVENRELAKTIEDIRAMANLGKYYAHKIHGAVELALYRETGEKNHQIASVTELIEALQFWRTYTEIASKQYHNPLWTNRVGYCDWDELTLEVENDIAIARK
ncbi:MAG: carbohydrate-binding family 6 protein [bacterium]|nr:carbohydrate-binding family 6 protein [bacterium]